ncbi:hypothetical protein BD560DRAFT_69176 [Blakeslea trispora]|nr:hypothetical protein BD560DRAFT_69176 [Blakeslea trispora]
MFKCVLYLLIVYTLCVSALSRRGLTELNITAAIYGREETRELRCSSAGGNFPHPELICPELRKVNQTLQGLPPANCTFVGVEVMVTIKGRFKNRPISIQEKFSNYCDAIRRFGILIKDILPSFYE